MSITHPPPPPPTTLEEHSMLAYLTAVGKISAEYRQMVEQAAVMANLPSITKINFNITETSPLLSVMGMHSSSICNNNIKNLLCAYSLSSNKQTLYSDYNTGCQIIIISPRINCIFNLTHLLKSWIVLVCTGKEKIGMANSFLIFLSLTRGSTPREKPQMKTCCTYIRRSEDGHEVGDATHQQEHSTGVAPPHPAEENTMSSAGYP